MLADVKHVVKVSLVATNSVENKIVEKIIDELRTSVFDRIERRILEIDKDGIRHEVYFIPGKDDEISENKIRKLIDSIYSYYTRELKRLKEMQELLNEEIKENMRELGVEVI